MRRPSHIGHGFTVRWLLATDADAEQEDARCHAGFRGALFFSPEQKFITKMKTNSPPCRWLSILISLYFYTTGSVTASNWQGASAAAQATVHNMDLTVNRCEKFYQYACGNWLNAHPASDTDTILVADQFGIADNRIQVCDYHGDRL